MNRDETWKRPRDDIGHRDFMEPPRYGHKLSPAFTYGRLHPAAYADQVHNTGRFDGSSEQAPSRDLDRGRDLRQGGYGKKARTAVRLSRRSSQTIEGATWRLAASM